MADVFRVVTEMPECYDWAADSRGRDNVTDIIGFLGFYLCKNPEGQTRPMRTT